MPKLEILLIPKITPKFKQENYDDGNIAGTQALVNALSNQKDSKNQTSTTSSKETNNTELNQSDNSFGSLPFFGLIIILTVITGLLFNKLKHSRRAERNSTSGVISSSGSSGGSSGSSGGGAGGGGFGGGSSGGGGAGGSF